MAKEPAIGTFRIIASGVDRWAVERYSELPSNDGKKIRRWSDRWELPGADVFTSPQFVTDAEAEAWIAKCEAVEDKIAELANEDKTILDAIKERAEETPPRLFSSRKK